MKKNTTTIKRRGKLHRMKEIWRRFKKNKAAVLGLVIVVLFVLVAIFADVIVPYEEVITQHIMDKMQPPSAEHWFGTDNLGRDIFGRVIHGTRYSLLIGLVTTGLAMIVGLALAAAAAYYGGIVDTLIMRGVDVLTSIPALLLAMSIAAALGASVQNLFIALTIVSIPAFTRNIRSALLNVVNQEYIEAARACGTSTPRILIKHVLTNGIGTIIVAGTMSVASKIHTAATLSFLGLGFQPPTPEWGAMLSEAREFLRVAGYMMIAPGMALIISSVAINLMGDGLRDALDPKLKN